MGEVSGENSESGQHDRADTIARTAVYSQDLLVLVDEFQLQGRLLRRLLFPALLFQLAFGLCNACVVPRKGVDGLLVRKGNGHIVVVSSLIELQAAAGGRAGVRERFGNVQQLNVAIRALRAFYLLTMRMVYLLFGWSAYVQTGVIYGICSALGLVSFWQHAYPTAMWGRSRRASEAGQTSDFR